MERDFGHSGSEQGRCCNPAGAPGEIADRHTDSLLDKQTDRLKTNGIFYTFKNKLKNPKNPNQVALRVMCMGKDFDDLPPAFRQVQPF